MDKIKAYNFLQQNMDCLFPNNEYSEFEIENELLECSELAEYSLESIPFRKPSTVQLIAIFLGLLGVDRFYLGDIGKGILKYITIGGLGIWWVKDIISAKERCRVYNNRKLIEAIHDPSVVQKMNETDGKIKWAGEMATKIINDLKE